ncbi:Enoyl-CoA hydratase/carnithine racemase [Melghirimyces algeriensis]|uniref:Enoyl-CoA hydratase/carnithine racemase n=2 Tax=Melghirimyces algeriensis TaxID=910412 RepID=A0A521AAI3_9BACL|nr:Enoyl-CoA hydratase/carnithine racemase [Melghirimyces algeriensis]
MDTKAIFRALQAGEITTEQAYAELAAFLGPPEGDERGTSNDEEEAEPIQGPVVELQEVESGIFQVTMQERTHKNTFSTELITGLMQVFESLRANKDCKVVILTGYDTYFACGGTQEGLLALYEGKAKMTDLHLYSLPLECDVPIIAAMQGHGLGGGLCLGLFCDFVIMSRESTYACNHMSYGFTPGDGATLILPRVLGYPLAQELLFTGKNVKGTELADRGASVPILPRKEVLPHARKMARELAEKPRESLMLLKQHMVTSLKADLTEVVEKEWAMQEKTLVHRSDVLEKMMPAFDSSSNPSAFPELLHLNQHFTGRPVFWLHGEGGGVEGYQWVAEKTRRPFYGIQARGHMTEHPPIRGIKAMAAYYVSMIQSKQAKGPYDLGGYSLGGLLAYEVARQLQEAGERVQSLVMLDTPDPSSWEKIRLSSQSRALQAVNMALLNRNRKETEAILQKLIHHKEIPEHTDEAELLIHLIRLGRERGLSLTLSETGLLTLFQHHLRMQAAFELNRYTLSPLPHASEVTCHYVRNQSGSFYGELTPYLTTDADEITIDHTCYWEEWERVFPRFYLLDAASTSHMTLLFEPEAQADITLLCQELYD